ncbi:hypothetical protein WJX77_001954 [Trebouxia sp. C0004]
MIWTQLHAMVRLRLEDIRRFLDDLHGRADTVNLLMMRGQAQHPDKDQGGCETECNQMREALTQLTKQGMHSPVRSTIVRMMALFAAMHCFLTPSSELVEFRQKHCLHLQQQLAHAWVVSAFHLHRAMQQNVHCMAIQLTTHYTLNSLISSHAQQRTHPEKKELYECENAVADLTGRAHYCDALYSRGLCHLTLENFEKAFDDILRADALDNRIGEYVLGSLEIAAAIDPGHPRVQKSAELCAALKRRKMNSLKAVDDNSCWERRTFDQKMTTIVTLVRMGDHHRATINLNEVIKHLDPFSPNIREQSEAVNQLNTMLHESAVAAHDPTLAANNKSGSAATNRADTSEAFTDTAFANLLAPGSASKFCQAVEEGSLQYNGINEGSIDTADLVAMLRDDDVDSKDSSEIVIYNMFKEGLGQIDSELKIELDKHVTAVASNIQDSKDFSAARHGLKRVLALHDIIACLQGSEASADRLADERTYYLRLLEECELGLKVQSDENPATKAGEL